MARSLTREMDLRFEAGAASEFAEIAAIDGYVSAPKVDWERTSQRILTTEWIEGRSLTNPGPLTADQRIDQLMGFVQSKSSFSRQEIETAADNGVNEMLSTVKNKAGGIFSATTQGMTNFFLSFIYTLLFLLFHKRIKRATAA